MSQAPPVSSPTEVGEHEHEHEHDGAGPLTDWAALLAEVDRRVSQMQLKAVNPTRLDPDQKVSTTLIHTRNSLMRRTDDPAAEPYRSKYEARRRLLATTPPTTTTAPTAAWSRPPSSPGAITPTTAP